MIKIDGTSLKVIFIPKKVIINLKKKNVMIQMMKHLSFLYKLIMSVNIRTPILCLMMKIVTRR